MDKTIPIPAAKLLNFIYQTETSQSAPECYEVIYANKQYKLAKPLTSMSLGEVQSAQMGWSKAHGSSATGAPQFMYATLNGLKKELGLRVGQIFNGDLQDRLAYHLLKRRGYLEYMGGTMSRTEFGKRLAQEWASFPVLGPTKGAHRQLTRGQSYYAGDRVNKSLTSPETVEKVLDSLRNGVFYEPPEVIDQAPKDYPEMTPPTNKPKSTVSPGVGATAVVTFGVVVGTFWEWFSNIPCNLISVFCGG